MHLDYRTKADRQHLGQKPLSYRLPNIYRFSKKVVTTSPTRHPSRIWDFPHEWGPCHTGKLSSCSYWLTRENCHSSGFLLLLTVLSCFLFSNDRKHSKKCKTSLLSYKHLRSCPSWPTHLFALGSEIQEGGSSPIERTPFVTPDKRIC